MPAKKALAFLWCMSALVAGAQTNVVQPSFSSAGTNVSANTTQRVYSVIGQPIALNSIVRSQTQAGFLQVTNYTIIDAVAPDITYSLSTLKIDRVSPPTVSVTITDNVGVASAKIFYRRIADAAWSSANLSSSGNTYSALVQNSWFDAMGMEYYFEATDATPNKKRSPATGSYYAYLTAAEETITSDRIGFGSSTSNYKIIAMPYTTGNNAVASLFDELGDWSDTKFRMATYNTQGNSFLEYPGFSSLERGVGYWMLVRTPVVIKIQPTISFPENRAAVYKMTLKPGWNMIGNPYPVAINWDDVRTLNNQPVIGTMHAYNNGWSSSPTLAPYEGGFVLVGGTNDVPIKIPFVGQTAEGTRISASTIADLTSPNWLIKMDVVQEGNTNALGGFGMNPAARFTLDDFDDFSPPSLEASPSLEFSHPEHRLKLFCRDVIPTQSEATWSFTVAGQVGASVALEWNKIENGTKELFLLDEVNLTITNLTASDRYEFVLASNHAFKVYFGNSVANQIIPDHVSMVPPFPNPLSAGENPTFRFALSDQASYTVAVDLWDASGSVVGNFVKAAAPGIVDMTLDFDNRLQKGVYVYRIRINSAAEQKVFTGKLVVL